MTKTITTLLAATALILGVANTYAWSEDRMSGWVAPSITQQDLDGTMRVLRDFETINGKRLTGAELTWVRGQLNKGLGKTQVGDNYMVHSYITRTGGFMGGDFEVRVAVMRSGRMLS